MANININIRMDADLKEEFEAFCSDVGMTVSTAINIYVRKVLRENRIPFEINGDKPNPATIDAIQEVQYMKNTPHPVQTYNDVDSMLEGFISEV